MKSSVEQRLAVLTCVELVLMRKGNTNYNLIVAKLNSTYNCSVIDCFDHPDYLRAVIRDVYDGEYDSVVGEIREQLGDLANTEEIDDFLKKMSEGTPATS